MALGATAGATASGAPGLAADLTGVLDVLPQFSVQFVAVLTAQVDFTAPVSIIFHQRALPVPAPGLVTARES